MSQSALILDPAMESLYALYGKVVLEDYSKKFEQNHVLKQIPAPDLTEPKPIKIGILGAGAAGMYAAMIIDSLEDPTITYEILEADPKRPGGRLLTYKFQPTERKDERPPGPNDYYDVGAMRFPDSPIMRRTFHLFDYLDITHESKQRIPYVMSIPENMHFFNGIRLTNKEIKEGGPDPFKVGMAEAYSDMINAKLKGFQDYLAAGQGAEDLERRFRKLYSIMDNYSTRSFFSSETPYSPDSLVPVRGYTQKEINNIETFGSGSNNYDAAVLEGLLSRMHFDWPSSQPVKWFCIQDGTKVIADAMAKKIKGPIKFGTRVTAIVPHTALTEPIDVHTIKDSEIHKETYTHVISTLPFTSFRNVDTSRCDFSWDLQTAIRCLKYGAAIKIAIRFSERWWETEKNQFGGVSRTDRPTRVVVYPSYGIDSKDSATMIVSYCWEQDALRLSSMFQGKESDGERRLISIIIRDLSDMHGYPDSNFLTQLVVDYHVWNWYADDAAGGGGANFGPGQFSTLFPLVTQPYNNGRITFAGEATSIHHAWLVGALDSTYRCVYHILKLARGKDSKAFQDFKRLWGNPTPHSIVNLANAEPAPLELSDGLLDMQLRVGISAS